MTSVIKSNFPMIVYHDYDWAKSFEFDFTRTFGGAYLFIDAKTGSMFGIEVYASGTIATIAQISKETTWTLTRNGTVLSGTSTANGLITLVKLYKRIKVL